MYAIIILPSFMYMGVLCCFALFVSLILLASFFLPSHLSFKNMYMYLNVHDLMRAEKEGRSKQGQANTPNKAKGKATHVHVHACTCTCTCIYK